MTKHNRPWASLAAPLLLPWALAGLPGVAAAEEPLGDKCNPNQGLTDLAAVPDLSALSWGGGVIRGQLTGIPLEPGHTVPTKGTNEIESPELVGSTVLNEIHDFSFTTGGEPAAGTYQELIKASDDDGTCKQQTKLKLVSGCISKVLFTKYFHPLDIVADYRDDLAGKVRSKRARRSPDGLTIEFQLKAPVCAGKTTRWLLLNTSVLNMTSTSALQLVSTDGTVSPPLPIRVPATIR